MRVASAISLRACRWAPHALAVALAQGLAALAILAHRRGELAAPRLALGEGRAAALRVEALRRRRGRRRWSRRPNAGAFITTVGVPEAIALQALILALLARIAIHRSIAVAAPIGHVVSEGRAAALRDVASRARFFRCWCWSWRPNARAAWSSAAVEPMAVALQAPLLALLAPITVDRSVASAAPRGHVVSEGWTTALLDVASRMAFGDRIM